MTNYEKLGMDPKYYKPYEVPIYGLALVYRLLEYEVTKYLNRYGLGVIKFNILVVVLFQSAPEGVSQVEIGRKVIVTASNITRLLERMEEDGLVKRYPHKTDKRVNLIRATPKARELMEKLWPGYQETIRGLLSKLEEGEQQLLATIMANWFARLRVDKGA